MVFFSQAPILYFIFSTLLLFGDPSAIWDFSRYRPKEKNKCPVE